MKLTQLQVNEKNHYQNCLTWSNIQAANVVSDVFGKSAQSIIESILDHPEEETKIGELVHKSMTVKAQALEITIDSEITTD